MTPEEKSREVYPLVHCDDWDKEQELVAQQLDRRVAFVCGYEAAEEDILALIESRLSEIIGDAQPMPVLRAELQELINKIKKSFMLFFFTWKNVVLTLLLYLI